MKPEKTFDDAMESVYKIMLNEWSKEEIIEYIRSRDGYTKNDMTSIIPTVTVTDAPNEMPYKESEHNKVYETIKLGLEDAINGRVVEHHSVSCWADTPIVEYAPVVRCKDCKRFAEFTSNGKTMGFGSCNNPQNIMSKCPQADWFCADGVRKEQEDG